MHEILVRIMYANNKDGKGAHVYLHNSTRAFVTHTHTHTCTHARTALGYIQSLSAAPRINMNKYEIPNTQCEQMHNGQQNYYENWLEDLKLISKFLTCMRGLKHGKLPYI